MPTRLLVLACSARKRDGPELLPALERYDGPAFRVLRKSLKAATDPPRVLILSAEFGLIPSTRPLPAYDRLLTPTRADELRPTVLAALAAAVVTVRPVEVAVCLGRVYRRALAGWESLLPPGTKATTLGGGQGTRLRTLKGWLDGG